MIMQHIRERAVVAALTVIAIVFALSYLKSCTHAPAATPVSSTAAPVASTSGANRQVFLGCPEIPLSASSSEMRAAMAKCGRAADANQARIEARLAAQSKAAWAAQAKRADAAQAAFNSSAPAATAASDIDGPLTLVLPSQSPPVGLKPGRADYALASARPAHEFSTTPGKFVQIGSAPVTAATSSFGSLPDKDLAAMAPRSGFARETWTFWIKFKNAGPHVMALRFDGGWGSSASIALDGQPKPVATVKSESVVADQQSAVGSVNVAAGWHRATITLVQYANVIRIANTEVDLFVRGPSAASPLSITPFSPSVNSTKPAAPAPAAHPISSGAFFRPRMRDAAAGWPTVRSMDMKKLIWDAERNFLALWRPDGNKIVAQVQKLDRSRWLAIVFYDMPGSGAASVKPSRTSAVEWSEETVSAAWPHDSAAVVAAHTELCSRSRAAAKTEEIEQ